MTRPKRAAVPRRLPSLTRLGRFAIGARRFAATITNDGVITVVLAGMTPRIVGQAEAHASRDLCTITRRRSLGDGCRQIGVDPRAVELALCRLVRAEGWVPSMRPPPRGAA